MEKVAAESWLGGAPADLWRRTLSQIPTEFGKLVYLASLRNANSGLYEHHGLALIFGDQAAHSALQNSHEEAFSQWINTPLQQQKADLDEYLSSLSTDKRAVVETWLRLAPYRHLVPATSRESERNLFSIDFQSLLLVLQGESNAQSPDPEDR